MKSWVPLRLGATVFLLGSLPVPPAAAPSQGPREQVLILLDLSFSMTRPLGPTSRIAAARRVFKDALPNLPDDTPLGLRLLAQVSERDDVAACRVTTLSVPVRTATRDQIADIVASQRPVGRKTPLAYALERAKEDLAALQGQKRVILLSDGIDTCGGDPIRAAEALRQAGVRVDTIGIGNEGASQLGRVALAGGGAFHLATNFDTLAEALRNSLARKEARAADRRRAAAAGPTRAAGADPEAAMHLEIVLDASGSMAAKVGDRTKMAVAQEALSEAVSALEGSKVRVAFRAFGFDSRIPKEKEASCQNTELLVGFDQSTPDAITASARKLGAYGYTPIAASLRLAGQDLQPYRNRRPTILLISDGEETCDGNPVAEIRALRQRGVEVRVDVIGFDLDTKARAQMRAIARAGGGRYDDARDPAGLIAALKSRAETLRAEASATPGPAAARRSPAAPAYPLEPGSPVNVVLENYFTYMRGTMDRSSGKRPSPLAGLTTGFWMPTGNPRVPAGQSMLFFTLYQPSDWKVESIEESGDFARARVEMTLGKPGRGAPVRTVEYGLVRVDGNWLLMDFADLDSPRH